MAIQICQREAANAAFRVRYYSGFQAFTRGLGMYPPSIKGGLLYRNQQAIRVIQVLCIVKGFVNNRTT